MLLASEEWARARNLPVLAYFSYSKQWAVDYVGGNEGLLMAPAYAVPAMLKDANLTLQDFDFYEIHEAFAAQVLCTLKAWESPEYCKERLGLDQPLGSIDRAKLNVNGSSVAIGHPFAATGTRIVASAGEAAGRVPHRQARADLGVHRGRHGRRGDPRESLNGAGPAPFQLVSDETKLTARTREVVHEALRPLSEGRRPGFAPGARRPAGGHLRTRDQQGRLLRPGRAPLPPPSADRLGEFRRPAAAARVRLHETRRHPGLALGRPGAAAQRRGARALLALRRQHAGSSRATPTATSCCSCMPGAATCSATTAIWSFEAGDYLLIPRGTMWRVECARAAARAADRGH